MNSKDDQLLPLTSDRKTALAAVAAALVTHLNEHEELQLLFVCTHNSRRSQTAEFFARIHAQPLLIQGLQIGSCGTEQTAFHPNMVAAIRRKGYALKAEDHSSNPRFYIVDFPENLMYSKTFAQIEQTCAILAIMVCDHANEQCPFIPGTVARIPLMYQDPKYADDTEEERSAYDRTVNIINQEMQFLFDIVKERQKNTKN